jgi:K+-sensing histidine kinase KdpD
MSLLKQLTEYFTHKSKPFLKTANIALLLCIGLVDYTTGYEIGMSLFYLIPISFAGWFGGRLPGIIMSSLSVLTIALANFMAGKVLHHLFIEVWNLLTHLGFFFVYSVVLSLVKTDLDERKRLVEELQKAMSEVKQLSGILPICASCKQIRDDEGYWKQIESYISDHSEAQFSHGICPECLKKLYPEQYEKIISEQRKVAEKRR